MMPPPRHSSPSYKTHACPGVTLLTPCGYLTNISPLSSHSKETGLSF